MRALIAAPHSSGYFTLPLYILHFMSFLNYLTFLLVSRERERVKIQITDDDDDDEFRCVGICLYQSA